MSPTNTLSKICVIALICVAIGIIPAKLGELAALASAQNPYRHNLRHHRHFRGESHAVLFGASSYKMLSTFLTEFYHPNHAAAISQTGVKDVSLSCHLVIVAPGEPNDDIQLLLSSPLIRRNVHYYDGSLLSALDMYVT